MRELFSKSLMVVVAAVVMAPITARAQASGQWHVAEGDAAHDGWQNTESKISAEALQEKFKLVWKLKLGKGSTGFNELMYTPQMISSRGFKDIGLWADATSLYAVDYELGTLLWQKDLNVAVPAGCAAKDMQILMDPPRVIRFGAKTATTAKAAPTAPVVPPPPPPSAADRWIGAATQGGGFGLKGVYVVTPDGYLHEQIMANGKDYAPAVKLINSGSSGGGGAVTALNMSDKILYLESDGCSVGSREIWSIDLNSAAHTINSHAFQKSSAGDVAGPMIGNDGTVYVSTGNGVIALTAKELKNKDYFAAGGDVAAKVGPVAVGYNDKEFIVAAGKGGSIALLDAALLKTPVSETGKVFDVSRSAGWQALASWREKSGSAWVLASVNAAASGKVVAFKIGDESGHAALTTAWSSGAMRNVAPPVIANGIVFALEGGDAGHHAVLHALDAATGKELYSSGDAIDGYSTMSGLSVGDGHVFFATHDGVVYAFGIPLEH